MMVDYVTTSSVDLVDVLGTDLSIVKAAVVSTGLDVADWQDERVQGLISRLMADRHGAPFEHVVFTFKVTTPLFTARQMMRHRIASFNEASGRYKVLPATFYVPPPERPLRQEGKAMDYNFVADDRLHPEIERELKRQARDQYDSYEWMLGRGCAREIARVVLGTNIMTEFMVSINLRSLFNVLSLRGKEPGLFPSHPQYEISQVADHMEVAVARMTPICYDAFVSAGRVAP